MKPNRNPLFPSAVASAALVLAAWSLSTTRMDSPYLNAFQGIFADSIKDHSALPLGPVCLEATPVPTNGLLQPLGALQIRYAAAFHSVQAAIDALPTRGGTVVLPYGTTLVSTPIIIDKPVTLLGHGFSPAFNNGVSQWLPASELKWSVKRKPSGPVIQIQPNVTTGSPLGVRLIGFSIDGDLFADVGISANRMQGGVIREVGVRNVLDVALHMWTNATVASDDCRDNIIQSFYAGNVPQVIRMEGNAMETANCSHNLFIRVTGNFHGTGIVINNGDNNTFLHTFLFRNTGSGNAVDLAANARANYFFHLEAVGGLLARSGSKNVVFAYDRENGQPPPVVQSNAILTWTEDGNNSTGWYIGNYLRLTNDYSKELAVVAARTAIGGQERLFLDASWIRFGTTYSTPDIELRSGRVGIGTTAPTTSGRLLQVGKSMDGTHAIASAWNTFSSRNYKKDIEPLTDEDYRDALTKILKTPVFRYRYRREPEQAKQRIGLIAEESPAEISDGDSIGLMRYIALLHAALKAQHKELQKVKKGLCGQKRRD